jgi:triosephosphate isomerase
MTRKPLIAGNWKMNFGTLSKARELASGVVELVGDSATCDVLICVPTIALHPVWDVVSGSPVHLGAQDCFWKESGAYTSQCAPKWLEDAGCTYVILGHSETRGRYGVPEPDFDETILAYFGESEATINRKISAALGAELTPIVCIGETLAEREAGLADAVITAQLSGALAGLSPEEVERLALAYEPVWAIGTGKTCDSEEANRVCGHVRATVASLFGVGVGEVVRILYGGSMKPDNAAELLGQPHIDGGLIGGASLKAADFAAIVAATK